MKEAPGFKIQSISLIEFTYIELSTKDATVIGIDSDVLQEFCENNGYEFEPSVKFDQITEISLAKDCKDEGDDEDFEDIEDYEDCDDVFFDEE